MSSLRTAKLMRVENEITLLCHTTPDLVAAVKNWIPAPWRAWDYEHRCWRFHSSQESTLRALLRFLDYRVEDGEAANERYTHPDNARGQPGQKPKRSMSGSVGTGGGF
jgi:hypothetical protein